MEKVAMTVQDVANALGLSRPVAYALVKSSGFPRVRVGKRIVIPVGEFHRWLSEQSRQGVEIR